MLNKSNLASFVAHSDKALSSFTALKSVLHCTDRAFNAIQGSIGAEYGNEANSKHIDDYFAYHPRGEQLIVNHMILHVTRVFQFN